MSIKEERKIEIESIVKDFCDDYDLSTANPIDVVAIARKKGFKVQRLNMDADTTGMLLYSEGSNITGLDTNKLIAVKNGLSEEQSRLILAHELGHFSLFSKETSLIAHRRYSHLKISNSEQEADYFARALLMPEKHVMSIIRNSKSENHDDNSIIHEIAETYNVTEAKAKIRFYEIEQRMLNDEENNSSNKEN